MAPAPPRIAVAVSAEPDDELEFFARWDEANDGKPTAPGAFPTPTLALLHDYRPTKAKTGPIVAATVAVLLLIGVAVAFINRDRLSAGVVPDRAEAKASPQPKDISETKSDAVPVAAPAFPRRILAVSINQYLYANPILFGSPKCNASVWLDSLAEKWRVPRDQVFLLTDSANNRGAVPPIKPIVEATIESYLASSRPQDRIVLLYAGHATVIDGKCYLVPLDGELKVKESLIPLDWLYDRMKSCKAQQKLLIFDAARYDPGRGLERPSPGPLDPELAAKLAAPPAGVQVWSACSAKEQSYEYSYARFDGYDIEGGLFLNDFLYAFLKSGSSGAKPDEPLPIEVLAPKVAELTQTMARGLEKQPQTSFVAGAAPGDGPAYDPTEPPAPRVLIPKASSFAKGGLADPNLIRGIIAEIKCPPIKATSANQDSSADDIANVFPFSAQTMKKYAPDYDSVREILDHPEKYPLRIGVLRGVEILERHGRGEVMVGPSKKQVGLLREEIAGPISDDVKKSIAKEQQEGPAAMYLELEDLVKSLERLAPQKAKEKSPRWLAHYDYILALAKARFAYVNEYNLMLGKIRKDELPTIDPKLHKGWRLASVEKMSSPRDVKDQADDARKLFAKLIKENPGTPWEILAKRDRITALGLVWQPVAVKGP